MVLKKSKPALIDDVTQDRSPAPFPESEGNPEPLAPGVLIRK
jgi:hypothetical protein